MRMKKMLSTLLPVLFAVLVFFISPLQAAQPGQPTKAAQPKFSQLRPITIEPASVLPHDQMAIDFGLTFEFDREYRDREYDNLRLAPMGIRYGLLPDFEIGAHLGFSANDEDDFGAPDDSGFEGLKLFGKLELNKFAAVQFGFNLGGDDDVFPYPSDDFDIFANLALQRSLGPGMLVGEFGYTAQGGDLDFNNYINYGLGYIFPMTQTMSLNAELSGEEDHYGTSANTLDLLLGANIIVVDQIRVSPYFTFGLFDAGPDYAFGAAVEVRF